MQYSTPYLNLGYPHHHPEVVGLYSSFTEALSVVPAGRALICLIYSHSGSVDVFRMMGEFIRQKERQKRKQRKMKGNEEMGNLGKRIGIK